MTTQTNISTAISPDYKRFGSPLYDLALANDLLAGYVLAGCPESAMPALLETFWLQNDYVYDLVDCGVIEDLWTNFVYDLACNMATWRPDIGNAPEQDLAVFTSRISALSEILNNKIEDAA